MVYSNLVYEAMNLCFKAHLNQYDKSGAPYVFHPFYLASKLDKEDEVVVALLHDVLEDSDYLIDHFPSHIIEAVKCMTHLDGEDYFTYIYRIKENELAKRVKIEDLKHNSDLSRLLEVTDKDLKRVQKYQKALAILEGSM